MPALRRITTGNGDEELVEGIENLQVLYGLPTVVGQPYPISNVQADLVASNVQWSHVAGVRVGLLASTVANTTDGQYGTEKDTSTYDVNGTPFTPPGLGDHRMRKVFVSTINLRNITK